MKGKFKLLPMFLFGICSLFLMGATDVFAATLTREPVDNVYWTRRGGGQDYMSGKYEKYSMDGKVVYCIEPGTPITTQLYNGQEGWVNSPYSDEINQKIQLIGYYGYEYPGHNTLRYRMATQSLVWETVGGQIIEWWTEASGWGDNINIDYEKGEIMKLVNAHYELPSFNGETKQTVIGQEVTFTDSKGILSNFEVVNSNVARIEGNNLIVKPTTVGDVNVSLKRKSYTSDPTTIFVGVDEKSQKMGYFGLNDPIISTIKVVSIGGKVTAEKLDSKTMSVKPLGDAVLTGARYGVYNEQNVRVGQVTIGENSTGTSDFLPSLGRFYLKEEKASYGYKLNETLYWFEVTQDNLYPKVNVYEDVIEADVQLFKMFADAKTGILKSEPNITFEFYLKSSMELYTTATTDSQGRLVVTLPFGTWIVRQKNSTPGYEKLKDFEIVVENEDDIHKVLSNAEITAKLKLVKVDSESRRVLVRDGIKFRIKNLDTGEYVCQSVTYPNQEKICVFETRGGMFITPYVLGTGNYQIEELEDQTIEGYVWNSTPFKFSINENSKFIYDEEYGVMLEVMFENKEVKGEVEVHKVGEKLVIEDNSYHYEEVGVDGVTYKLYAAEDIYSGDGTLIYKADELIGTYVTKDSFFKVTGLYLGKYYFLEESTIGNLVLDETKHYFELKYVDQYTDIVSLSFTYKNYLKKGDFEFNKKSVAGDPLPNTKIQIYTYEDDVEDAQLIFEGYTDSNGDIIIKGLFTGKFFLVESEAPEGYILDPEPKFFEIKEDGEIVKLEMTNEKIPVPNTSSNSYFVLIPISMITVGGLLLVINKKRKEGEK